MKTTLENNTCKINISKSAVLLLSLAITAFAFLTSGINTIYAADSTTTAACDPSSWKFCNPLAGTIENLTEAATKSVQALLGLIGTIALLFLIIAGITYITAAGDTTKVENAKKIVSGTVIGLGIALIAYSLLVTVSTIMGVK